MAAISISRLVKSFGAARALDGLDLSVRTGEVHGFLGPNGAGKSTAIRILLGLMRADSGEVELLGGDPWRDATELHRRLSYVPGDVSLWPGLTGGEVIDLLGRLRGGLNPGRRKELLERFELDPRKMCRAYSKGNRQKVALISALASDAWAAFIFINVFGEVLGPAMGVDFWIADQLTPFHHVPRILSGGELTAAPLLSLGAITALLMAAGLLAFRRRDLA